MGSADPTILVFAAVTAREGEGATVVVCKTTGVIKFSEVDFGIT